jgi:dihydroxy-acid dehydratase
MTVDDDRNEARPRLRSDEWYAGDDRNAYLHRAWMRRGVPANAFEGRPQIAIANTASDLTPCNAHLNEVSQAVQRGVYEAGGIPLDLPVVSLGETLVRPTAMLWRNMAAMAMEEMFRANPIDGLVLLGGCDKTIPALLMAAASVDLPAVVISGGPMLNGTFRGQALGCGTDVWRLGEEVRAGTLTTELFVKSESSMIRSRGHCNTMGTASSMSIMAEALGMTIPGMAGTPAPDSRLLEGAHECGRLAVDLVRQGLTISKVITRESFHNAIVALAAVGGSTNAVVHLMAIAGRLGIELDLADFDRIGAGVPLLVNLQPAGQYLMEDLYRAGGVIAVLAQVADLLDPGAVTVTGETLVQAVADHPVWDTEVITPRAAPLQSDAGIAVLRGNLAPHGAIVKPAAASAELLVHRGPALVFDSVEDLKARIDDEDLPVTPDTVLVLRGCGPRGYPGMPEVANLPLPKKMLRQGVRDMVRVCDGRMSGTAYGTVVLHVAPEAAAGGLLGLVQDGDPIVLDVPRRILQLDVPEEELALRSPPATLTDAFAAPSRGWERLYVEHVLQADTGADLDFLVGSSGPDVARESH